MQKDSKIAVIGSRGLVGGAISRALESRGYSKLLLWHRNKADFRDSLAVERLFAAEKPEFVFLAAGKVGGIWANANHPADFIYDNLAIETNVLRSSWMHGIKKLLFLGSSCIYPREAPQPIREEYLLTGPLEATNEAYAIAKIAGIKMAEAYRKQYGFNAISLMPTNLYGPGDNFDPETSHVLPALIRKFHEAKLSGAKRVMLWGSGSPRREFLHVDDLADASVFLMLNYEDSRIINVGTGEDITIRELAQLIAEIVQYDGELVFDRAKPDGTPRKLLDVSRLGALGWRYKIPLRTGVEQTYNWYVEELMQSAR